MALPANIRVNTSVPFPALVQGSGYLTVTKVNGIWTIALNPSLLGVQTPPIGNFPTDYVAIWDSIAKTWFSMPISTFVGFASARLQRSITTAGNLPVQAGDSILNFNVASDLTPFVPAAATRAGAPLTFKNLPASHIQTLTRSGADTFDGLTTYGLGPGASVTLVPYNDGVNAGYGIE